MKYEYPYLSLKVILMKQITYPVLVFYIEFENITRILYIWTEAFWDLSGNIWGW